MSSEVSTLSETATTEMNSTSAPATTTSADLTTPIDTSTDTFPNISSNVDTTSGDASGSSTSASGATTEPLTTSTVLLSTQTNSVGTTEASTSTVDVNGTTTTRVDSTTTTVVVPTSATNETGNTTATVTSSTTPTTTTAEPHLCSSAERTGALASIPYFDDITMNEDIVRAGLTMNLTLRYNVTLNFTTPINCITKHKSLSSIGGNAAGFAAKQPSSVTLEPTGLWSALLHISSVDGYDIDVMEGLQVWVAEADAAGAKCGTSELVLIGLIKVEAVGDPFGAATDTTTGVSVAVTVVSSALGGAGMAAEQQGLAAMAMMTCTDPHTQQAFGSYRALSPFALWDSYIGVVAGNFVFLVAVFIIQFLVLLVLKLAKRVRRWEELSAIARFPNVLLNCSFAVHTGTAYAASQLISLPDRPIEDRVVGGLAFAFVVLYPFGLIGFAYSFVGRAYQSYQISDWMLQRKLPAFVTYLLPQGAIYAAETRRAFGSYVAAYRLPDHYWPSYPTWTPMIFAIGGLFHPDTIPKCQALFCCMGIAFVLCCAVVVVRKPRRSDAANWLDGLARCLNASVLFCMAVAVEPGDQAVNAARAAFAFGFIQTSVTIIRFIYSFSMSQLDKKLSVLPLTHEWVHYTSDGAKTAVKFGGAEEFMDDLMIESSKRDQIDHDAISPEEMKSAPVLPRQQKLELANSEELFSSTDSGSNTLKPSTEADGKRTDAVHAAVKVDPTPSPIGNSQSASLDDVIIVPKGGKPLAPRLSESESFGSSDEHYDDLL
eukprot:GILI01006564.1.p1 GENE.GILI01006564.1~~GILI01006564.1.p1  ORF type:complete len:801 (-),score=145.60 GILI01006564.1:292-2604(-)